MKILTVCDQWNNRSVMFAHLLKYWGNDCIPVWLKTTSPETLKMLYEWADLIILTEEIQREYISLEPDNWKKIILLNVWPDIYPRPFNKELHEKVKKLLEENKTLLKN